MQSSALRIGTRGSPLALAQARMVAAALADAHALDPKAISIDVIRTTGDAVQDRPLSEIGGKGLFTKEIEQALIDNRIELAVHSMKDVATVLPPGLEIAAILEREDPRDALIANGRGSFAELPEGAVIGTSSLRRAALVRAMRPDLQVIGFRGNVDTRLRKLNDGEADATLLAMAGLNRLGLTDVPATPLAPETMLPAVAQGAVGIEIRSEDDRTRALVASLDHAVSATAVVAERAFLAALDGSCRTPIAAYARLDGGGVELSGLIVKPDGSEVHRTERSGPADEAERLGTDAGEELKALGGPDFFC